MVMLSVNRRKGKKRREQDADGTAQGPGGESSNGLGAAGAQMQSSAREEQIARMAYFKAQQRDFQGGDPLDDWLAAEREFNGADLARTVGQYGDEP